MSTSPKAVHKAQRGCLIPPCTEGFASPHVAHVQRPPAGVHILPGDMEEPEVNLGCAGDCEACEYRQGSVECMLTASDARMEAEG